MFRDLPRYPEMTVSQFWDAKVPSHWEVHPGLAVLAENRRKNDGLIESQVLSLSYGRVVVKPVEKQRGLVPDSYESYQILVPGDIVVRPTDLQNDQASIRVGHVKDRGIITSAYVGLRARGSWSDAYAYHYLAVVDSSKRIYGMGSGLRQQLGWPDLKRMPCLVPPPEEQAAIVKYLAHANARIDKAIAAKRRLIALLEEQGSGLRDQVLRSGDWPRRRLKTLLDRVDQGVSPQAENQEPGPGEWGVLKSGCVNGGSFRADQVKRLPDGFAIPEAMSVREGDLLVSRANGSPHLVGSAARVSGLKHQAILSDKTFRLIPSPTVDADFLALSMNAQAYRQQVRTAISGAEGLANNLPLSALKTFEFVVPPFQFQRELVRMVEEELSTLRLTMNRVTSEIALLQEFRTRLVADVVTGQVDVRAIATTLADVPECESRHLDDPIHTLESDTREDEVADE
ncbi:hypothetical protein [Microbacterium istanbulense]|uniref:Type I restriction modification DNA specificity domain-containing protein n=1 Tax=Microbacterium istanbulense TaxID=3122049 RepID=A0ABU8LMZ8_9MICO